MVVLDSCKYEEGPSKNEGIRVVTPLLSLYVHGDFSRRSMAGNSAVRGLIWPNFEPIQDFMVVLVTCKMKKIQSKLKVLEWSQHYSLVCKVSDGILPKLFQAFIIVLVTCKYEEDPSKNEGTRVVTIFLPL